MNEPNRTEWEIRCAFNGFCKRALKYEASNAHRDVRHHQLREVAFQACCRRKKNSFTQLTVILRMKKLMISLFMWLEWKLRRNFWLTLYTRCRKKNATRYYCIISLK